MEVLVVPVNNKTKEAFFNLLDERNPLSLIWFLDIEHNLEEGCFVFFPEVKKVVRLYKIEEVHFNYIVLSKAIADFMWFEWSYVCNSNEDTLNIDTYIISKEKTRGIYNYFNSKIK